MIGEFYWKKKWQDFTIDMVHCSRYCTWMRLVERKMKILCLNQVVKSGQNSWFQKLKAFFAQGFSGIFLGSYSFLTSTTVFLSVRHNLVFHIIVSKIWKWKIWYSFFLKILKGMHPIARDSRDSQGGKICASNGWQFIFMLVYIF